MRYGISTIVLGRTDLEAALHRIAAAGFEQIEILTEPPHLWPGDHEPQQVRALLDQLGLHARVGHGIFRHGNPNCGSLDEVKRRQAVTQIATCFEPLVAVGAEFVVLHPTGYALDYTDENRPRVIDQVRRSMAELSTIAADVGIRPAWENLPHHHTARPLHDMTELRSLINEMPANVGLCLDTTHALIAGHDPLEQLNIAAHRLLCLHLHDSDGDGDRHWVPGQGIIEWDPFIARLDEMGFTGTRTIEVISTNKTEDLVLTEAAAVARKWEGEGNV